MVRQRLDVSCQRQVNKFVTDREPNLLPGVSVDLPKLAQRLRLPVNRVHAAIISERYVLSTQRARVLLGYRIEHLNEERRGYYDRSFYLRVGVKSLHIARMQHRNFCFALVHVDTYVPARQ